MKVAFFFHMRGNSLIEEFIKDNRVKVSPAGICIPATYSHATGNVTLSKCMKMCCTIMVGNFPHLSAFLVPF